MDKILIEKEYILNRMKALEQTPVMQEYFYLNSLLKQDNAVEKENKPEGD